MWPLLRSQILYHAWWLGPVLLAMVLVGVGFGFFDPDLETEIGMWAAIIVVGGVMSGTVTWSIEQRERRLLLWLTLGVRPGAAHLARILTVSALPVSVFLLSIPSLAASRGAFDIGWLGEPFSLLGICLAAISLVFFSEEVNVRLSGRPELLWLFNVAMPTLIILVSYLSVSSATPWSAASQIAVWHGAALFLFLISYLLFRRRSTYLLGTDCTGWKPQDWSESSDA